MSSILCVWEGVATRLKNLGRIGSRGGSSMSFVIYGGDMGQKG